MLLQFLRIFRDESLVETVILCLRRNKASFVNKAKLFNENI